MRHRLATIGLTAALTAGALLAAAPAQAAPPSRPAAAAAGPRHDIPKRLQHLEELHHKAVLLDQLGKRAEAERTRNEAKLLQALIDHIIKSGREG
ncbi:hypothetical protein [Streptomyces virginiae]|uniref:hypothetical protein n=1 Tax=Streptomyces virginiae TaxID=1961 RepID=UPI002257FC69|nr:hypothetical protein [Streptomyces virginiae]MCX4960269.1 hypothetical protein [Streptomyces virginiae]